MNLRNAFVIVAVSFVSMALAKGQQASVPSVGPEIPTYNSDNVPLGSGQNRGGLSVHFTGHLLGYYRWPEWQHDDFEPACPDAPKPDGDGKYDTPAKNPAEQFLRLESDRPGDILVGTGDNFGVTLESRSFRDSAGQLHAKARNLGDPQTSPWYTAPASEIGDNVGCFFYRAGYDAIVPGKDDFYFGPERLRRLADRLANVKDPKVKESHPVQMLAANLVLKTDYLKKQPEIQDADKGLKFIPGTPTGVKSLDISDNDSILPFARQIRFEISRESSYSTSAPDFVPFLCGVNGDDGLDRLDPRHCKTTQTLAMHPKENSQEKTTESGEDAVPAKVTLDFDLPADWPPKELPALYGLCSEIKNPDLKALGRAYIDRQVEKHAYYCQRFTVVPPLFGDAMTDPWVLKPLKQRPGEEPSCKKDRFFCQDAKFTCPDGKAPCPDEKSASMDKKPACKEGHRRCAGKPSYAVIFGVVDKDLTTLIGRDNLSWRNREPKTGPGKPVNQQNTASTGKETYGTTVAALDEGTSLGIAMRSFDLQWKKTHGDEPVYKILLAQMTRGKAETLAANLSNTQISDTSLRFDVVISAAADFSAATADEEVKFRRPVKPEIAPEDDKKESDETVPQFRHFVAVPWLSYESGTRPRAPDPLRSLTLSDSECGSGPCNLRTLEVGGQYEKAFPLSEPVGKDRLQACYDALGYDYLAQKNYWRDRIPAPPDKLKLPDCSPAAAARKTVPQPRLENAFELAVLAALRDRTHADVAMLQKRSFYWGPFPLPPGSDLDLRRPNDELLERVLWMGDYLDVLSVKGSALKKVLDESDQLDTVDAQATHEIVETSRGVLALGVEKTKDKQYLVDGMQIDPNRLYTVATSNHIAAGDNGYPDLADPLFADTRLPKPDTAPRISSVVCEELRAPACAPGQALDFAGIKQLPPQLNAGLPGFARAYVRSVFGGRPELPADAYNRTNYQAQLIPTWRFSLKDLSFNLSSVRNNLTEPLRLTELGGVTEPGAGNAKSHAINFSTHLEWVRSTTLLDEFIRGLSQYQDTVTGNTATVPILNSSGMLSDVLYQAPALTTYSKNLSAVDAGFFLHPGGHKYFDKLGVVLEPIHFDTQVAKQELLFPAAYDPAGSGNVLVPAVPLHLPRNRNLLSRLAFRSESDTNHFELGYQIGEEFNALDSLTSNIGTCPALILTLCLETQEAQAGFSASSVTLGKANRERNGPYADMDWTWPLIWRLSFRTQESFSYFAPAHSDNPVDTLYRNDVTETLSFKVLPNLSIGPSLERFDYENKIEHVHLRTWSPTFQITYSFDVLRGSKWSKSWQYSPSGGSGSQ